MKNLKTSKHFRLSSLLLLAGALTFTACEKDDNDTFIDDNDIAQLFVSSNTNSELTVFKIDDYDDPVEESMAIKNSDADGVHYDMNRDVLYQLDRTNSRINIYQDFSENEQALMTPNVITPSDFTNGREVAVSSDGRYLVAAQDEDDKMSNRFFIYFITPFGLELDRIYETSIDLWGIHFMGDHLFAVEDNTGNLVAFHKFFNHEDGDMVEPTAKLIIEDARHLRGVDYDGINDILFLTDMRDAEKHNDGRLIVIHDFLVKAADILRVESEVAFQRQGFLMIQDQVRIFGNRTKLGNPVDVSFCRQSNKVYVAERNNGGGQMLEFALPHENGNEKPTFRAHVPGASSVCVSVMDVPGF
ncbi:MAG: hypothetical protein AAGK47_05260 [Bacteroidota bacterium]